VAEKRDNPSQGQQYCLNYEYERSHSGSDSRPNLPANETAGPLFARFMVDAVHKVASPVATKAGAFGSMTAENHYYPAEDEDLDGDADGKDLYGMAGENI